MSNPKHSVTAKDLIKIAHMTNEEWDNCELNESETRMSSPKTQSSDPRPLEQRIYDAMRPAAAQTQPDAQPPQLSEKDQQRLEVKIIMQRQKMLELARKCDSYKAHAEALAAALRDQLINDPKHFTPAMNSALAAHEKLSEQSEDQKQ